DDTIYLTDSKKKVHIFDLKDGRFSGSESFDTMFERIRDKGRFNKTELTSYDSSNFLSLPKLRDGRDASQALADYLGMKVYDISNRKDEQYRFYGFKMDCNVLQDGSLEIENIEVDDGLPKEKIIEFFKVNKFDTS